MREIAALLAALTFASPASAAETFLKSCPLGQVDYSTDGSMICGWPPIDLGFSKPLNCKVGESPVWVSNDGFKCEAVAVPKCPDGWHLVLTQTYAPICAWVLREPGH